MRDEVHAVDDDMADHLMLQTDAEGYPVFEMAGEEDETVETKPSVRIIKKKTTKKKVAARTQAREEAERDHGLEDLDTGARGKGKAVEV